MIADLLALAQVVLIDITLAGDNAVVVALAVAGLPPQTKRRAILAGLSAATVIRIALSAVAVSLLHLLGLTLTGGLLLLWVCWKMYRELRARAQHGEQAAAGKTLRQAIQQIIVADLSMSLDNVLAVAGAAHGHFWVMAGGLGLSILLMAVAANLLATLLATHRWIGWAGLAAVFYVSLDMIVRGGAQIGRVL